MLFCQINGDLCQISSTLLQIKRLNCHKKTKKVIGTPIDKLKSLKKGLHDLGNLDNPF